MLRILSVLVVVVCCGCSSSEPPLPASTFQHDATVLSGKPFGDPPDFAKFLEKQTDRKFLLMADLKRTRGLKDVDDRTQVKLMLSPLKLRRMELNSMLKNLDSVDQWSPEQRNQARTTLKSEAEWVNESITALLQLK